MPIYFKTVDLNYDGIPELLIDDWNSCEADGTKGIYTYVNGKPKFIIALSETTKVYKKKKTYYVNYAGGRMGGAWSIWYKVKNNKATEVYRYMRSDTGKKTYKKKKTKISRTTYKKAIKAMKKNTKLIKFNKMHKSTKANRSKYLA